MMALPLCRKMCTTQDSVAHVAQTEAQNDNRACSHPSGIRVSINHVILSLPHSPYKLEARSNIVT